MKQSSRKGRGGQPVSRQQVEEAVKRYMASGGSIRRVETAAAGDGDAFASLLDSPDLPNADLRRQFNATSSRSFTDY